MNSNNPRELRAKASEILKQLEGMHDRANTENRTFTASEQSQWDELLPEVNRLIRAAELREAIPMDLLNQTNKRSASFNRSGLGDDEARALAAYIKSGDRGALAGMEGDGEFDAVIHLPRTSMRATDQALDLTDGGPAVPTGLAGQIAARMSEMSLPIKLGCRQVPGIGTTVNYPYESAAPAVFAATSEQDDAHAQTYQRDRPSMIAKAFTYAKKTKKN